METQTQMVGVVRKQGDILKILFQKLKSIQKKGNILKHLIPIIQNEQIWLFFQIFKPNHYRKVELPSPEVILLFLMDLVLEPVLNSLHTDVFIHSSV
jgi:hypothetical protein